MEERATGDFLPSAVWPSAHTTIFTTWISITMNVTAGRAMAWFPLLVMLAAIAHAPRGAAAEPAIAFVGAKIIPIAGDEIPSGTLLVAEGKIVAVGPTEAVTIPDGCPAD